MSTLHSGKVQVEIFIAWKFKELPTAPGNNLNPKLKSIHDSELTVEVKRKPPETRQSKCYS